MTSYKTGYGWEDQIRKFFKDKCIICRSGGSKKNDIILICPRDPVIRFISAKSSKQTMPKPTTSTYQEWINKLKEDTSPLPHCSFTREIWYRQQRLLTIVHVETFSSAEIPFHFNPQDENVRLDSFEKYEFRNFSEIPEALL